MAVLILRSGPTTAAVDPQRGLTIRSLRIGGSEVMATVPWDAGPVRTPSDPRDWVLAWQGGWQPALPNAGRPGQGQGYHGNASQAPWQVVECTGREMVAEWSEDSLIARRVVTALDDGLIVHCGMRNTGDTIRPVLVTEHLVLGSDALDATVDAAGTTVHPLGDQAEQLPGEPWPGRADPDWSVAAAGRTPQRCAAIEGAGPDGVVVRGDRIAVRVRWRSSVLPYFWLWQSVAAQPAPPWNGTTKALGIEPSTTPHGQGISAVDGHRLQLDPCGSVSWWVSLRRESAA